MARQHSKRGIANCPCPLNEPVAISRSRDKLRSVQLLARKEIGLPVTGFANNPDGIEELMSEVGSAPLVIKLLNGTQGMGVIVAKTHNAAESVIQSVMGLKANIIENSKNKSITRNRGKG